MLARMSEVGWAGCIGVLHEGPGREQQQVGGGVVRAPENQERDRGTRSGKRGMQTHRGRQRQPGKRQKPIEGGTGRMDSDGK